MTPISVGKGYFRLVVRNARTRTALSVHQGIIVDGNRVYFRDTMTDWVNSVIEKHTKKKGD